MLDKKYKEAFPAAWDLAVLEEASRAVGEVVDTFVEAASLRKVQGYVRVGVQSNQGKVRGDLQWEGSEQGPVPGLSKLL